MPLLGITTKAARHNRQAAALAFRPIDSATRSGRHFRIIPGQPCFPPHTEARQEILGSNLGLCCRRWHPAKTPGVLRFASSVLHILSQTLLRPFRRYRSPRAKRQRRTISARKVFRIEPLNSYRLSPENKFLKSSSASRITLGRTRSPQQAWIDSRNQTTIATWVKHRQLLFLHPRKIEGTVGSIKLGSIEFGSIERVEYEAVPGKECSDSGYGLTPAKRFDLMNLPVTFYTTRFPFRFISTTKDSPCRVCGESRVHGKIAVCYRLSDSFLHISARVWRA